MTGPFYDRIILWQDHFMTQPSYYVNYGGQAELFYMELSF